MRHVASSPRQVRFKSSHSCTRPALPASDAPAPKASALLSGPSTGVAAGHRSPTSQQSAPLAAASAGPWHCSPRD